MKRGKGKTNKQNIQLALFEEDQPAPVEQQAEQLEELLPKKRIRKKKSAEPPVPEETHTIEEQVASPALPLLMEEPLLQKPADPKITDQKEEELKAKYKKAQEARLEALRKARNKK